MSISKTVNLQELFSEADPRKKIVRSQNWKSEPCQYQMIRKLVLPWINGNLIKPIPLFCCSFKDHIFVHLQALAKFYCQWSIIVQRSVCLQLTRAHKLKKTPISSLKSVSIHLKILSTYRNE